MRELTEGTWNEFARFFARYGGVQDGCWCMFYHRARPNHDRPDDQRIAENRRDHETLVRRGEAHGVLVYADDQPVGWCQFGRTGELPRIDAGRKYRRLAAALPGPPDWRITCFFVDRPHRRSGVARVALDGALKSIRHLGGGVVEAYPTTAPGAVAIWFGTLSMFRRAGFRKVAPFGRSQVLVRRRLPPARGVSRARPDPGRPAGVVESNRRSSL